jgi:hypothetical protein
MTFLELAVQKEGGRLSERLSERLGERLSERLSERLGERLGEGLVGGPEEPFAYEACTLAQGESGFRLSDVKNSLIGQTP